MQLKTNPSCHVTNGRLGDQFNDHTHYSLITAQTYSYIIRMNRVIHFVGGRDVKNGI